MDEQDYALADALDAIEETATLWDALLYAVAVAQAAKEQG